MRQHGPQDSPCCAGAAEFKAKPKPSKAMGGRGYPWAQNRAALESKFQNELQKICWRFRSSDGREPQLWQRIELWQKIDKAYARHMARCAKLREKYGIE